MARTTLGLSKREKEVSGLVADGLADTKIVDKLFTSKRIDETYRQNIIAKTQAKNMAILIELTVR